MPFLLFRLAFFLVRSRAACGSSSSSSSSSSFGIVSLDFFHNERLLLAHSFEIFSRRGFVESSWVCFVVVVEIVTIPGILLLLLFVFVFPFVHTRRSRTGNDPADARHRREVPTPAHGAPALVGANVRIEDQKGETLQKVRHQVSKANGAQVDGFPCHRTGEAGGDKDAKDQAQERDRLGHRVHGVVVDVVGSQPVNQTGSSTCSTSSIIRVEVDHVVSFVRQQFIVSPCGFIAVFIFVDIVVVVQLVSNLGVSRVQTQLQLDHPDGRNLLVPGIEVHGGVECHKVRALSSTVGQTHTAPPKGYRHAGPDEAVREPLDVLLFGTGGVVLFFFKPSIGVVFRVVGGEKMVALLVVFVPVLAIVVLVYKTRVVAVRRQRPCAWKVVFLFILFAAAAAAAGGRLAERAARFFDLVWSNTRSIGIRKGLKERYLAGNL